MTTAFGFENDVKMYGTQTVSPDPSNHRAFENDVKMYGTQTRLAPMIRDTPFENDVKMYGTQTIKLAFENGLNQQNRHYR